MSVNKVIILGNLGADPDVRSTPSGQVATFRVACTERWKDQSGQQHESTEWVTCVAWKEKASIVQRFLRKGRQVYVEGKLKTRTWEDKNGGGKRYSTEVIVDRIELVGGAPAGGVGELGERERTPRETEYDPNAQPGPSNDDQDLPF